jgi:hypothetical protein
LLQPRAHHTDLRSYAIRRVRDAFKENAKVTDAKALENLIAHGTASLKLIRRQVRGVRYWGCVVSHYMLHRARLETCTHASALSSSRPTLACVYVCACDMCIHNTYTTTRQKHSPLVLYVCPPGSHTDPCFRQRRLQSATYRMSKRKYQNKT